MKRWKQFVVPFEKKKKKNKGKGKVAYTSLVRWGTKKTLYFLFEWVQMSTRAKKDHTALEGRPSR